MRIYRTSAAMTHASCHMPHTTQEFPRQSCLNATKRRKPTDDITTITVTVSVTVAVAVALAVTVTIAANVKQLCWVSK